MKDTVWKQMGIVESEGFGIITIIENYPILPQVTCTAHKNVYMGLHTCIWHESIAGHI